MSVEYGVAGATIRIRAPRRDWIVLFAGGLVILAMQTLVWVGGGDTEPAVLGGILMAESLWIRSFGVDLTPEFAIVRGLRRRHIRWGQVQAVYRFRQMGSDRVRLVLENGQHVNLRAPNTWLGLGADGYERDFHRIGQWWLAHRGQSWRPVRPEAPGAPTQH